MQDETQARLPLQISREFQSINILVRNQHDSALFLNQTKKCLFYLKINDILLFNILLTAFQLHKPTLSYHIFVETLNHISPSYQQSIHIPAYLISG